MPISEYQAQELCNDVVYSRFETFQVEIIMHIIRYMISVIAYILFGIMFTGCGTKEETAVKEATAALELAQKDFDSKFGLTKPPTLNFGLHTLVFAPETDDSNVISTKEDTQESNEVAEKYYSLRVEGKCRAAKEFFDKNSSKISYGENIRLNNLTMEPKSSDELKAIVDKMQRAAKENNYTNSIGLTIDAAGKAAALNTPINADLYSWGRSVGWSNQNIIRDYYTGMIHKYIGWAGCFPTFITTASMNDGSVFSDQFYKSNKLFLEGIEVLHKKVQIDPKGEFESSEEYEVRKKTASETVDSYNREIDADVKTVMDKVAKRALTSFLPGIYLDSNLSYDADKSTFSGFLSTKKGDFKIPFVMNYPKNEAEQAKKLLQAGIKVQPYIHIESDGELVFDGFSISAPPLLISSNTSWKTGFRFSKAMESALEELSLKNLAKTSAEIKVKEAKEAVIASKKKAEDDRQNAEMERQSQKELAERQKEEERIAADREKNGYLVSSGTVICIDMKQMMLAVSTKGNVYYMPNGCDQLPNDVRVKILRQVPVGRWNLSYVGNQRGNFWVDESDLK